MIRATDLRWMSWPLDQLLQPLFWFSFQVGKAEFLGRAVGKPSVHLCENEYKMASLEWFQIYRGTEEAGELLAAFEMFEVSGSLCIFASDQRWSRPRAYYSCWSCWIFPYVNALSLSVSIYLWIYPSIFQPIYWCIWPYEYQFIYTIISVSICQYRSW